MALTDYHDVRFRPFDQLFWGGRNFVSRAIALGTCSWDQLWRGEWISHGSFIANYGAALVNYESTTLCPLPCLHAGKLVNGVQCHDPYKEIEAYDGKVWLSRLIEPLTKYQIERLNNWAFTKLNVPYDYRQAIESGAPPWVKRLIWRRPDPTQMYCDEFELFGANFLRIVDDINPSRESPASTARLFVDRYKFTPLERIK